MALIVRNGVMDNDNEPWFDYLVLDDPCNQVYRVSIDTDGKLFAVATEEPEDNPLIKDKVVKKSYYLAISEEGILWLDTTANECTMQDLCKKMEQMKIKLDTIIVSGESAEETSDAIEVVNGWTAIL